MTPIDMQIQTMHDLASRHYPEDEALRNECLVRLLTERLRTFYTLYQQESTKGYGELRRAGFSWEEISLGMQDVVR